MRPSAVVTLGYPENQPEIVHKILFRLFKAYLKRFLLSSVKVTT